MAQQIEMPLCLGQWQRFRLIIPIGQEDQALFGPGHGDIKKPSFFFHINPIFRSTLVRQ